MSYYPVQPFIQQQYPYNAPNLPVNQFSNNKQGLVRVNGINGAKAYNMDANSTVALFDSNDDVFYIKTTDGAGFPSIRTFSFNEIVETASEQSIDNSDWVTKEEFEQFKREVTDIGKQFIQFTKQQPGQQRNGYKGHDDKNKQSSNENVV